MITVSNEPASAPSKFIRRPTEQRNIRRLPLARLKALGDANGFPKNPFPVLRAVGSDSVSNCPVPQRSRAPSPVASCECARPFAQSTRWFDPRGDVIGPPIIVASRSWVRSSGRSFIDGAEIERVPLLLPARTCAALSPEIGHSAPRARVQEPHKRPDVSGRHILPRHDDAIAHTTVGVSAVSILPQRERKPRTFTWWSRRPIISIRPSGR